MSEGGPGPGGEPTHAGLGPSLRGAQRTIPPLPVSGSPGPSARDPAPRPGSQARLPAQPGRRGQPEPWAVPPLRPGLWGARFLGAKVVWESGEPQWPGLPGWSRGSRRLEGPARPPRLWDARASVVTPSSTPAPAAADLRAVLAPRPPRPRPLTYLSAGSGPSPARPGLQGSQRVICVATWPARWPHWGGRGEAAAGGGAAHLSHLRGAGRGRGRGEGRGLPAPATLEPSALLRGSCRPPAGCLLPAPAGRGLRRARGPGGRGGAGAPGGQR